MHTVLSVLRISLLLLSHSFNGEQLERVGEYKYLGMIFDENLNWYKHINKMCAKMLQQLGHLQIIKFLYTKCNLKNAS